MDITRPSVPPAADSMTDLDPSRRNCSNCDAIMGTNLFWLSYWDQMPARFCGASCWAHPQETAGIVQEPISTREG